MLKMLNLNKVKKKFKILLTDKQQMSENIGGGYEGQDTAMYTLIK